MRVKLLQTSMGSENGYSVNEYTQGHTYEIENSLAQSFVNSNVGVQVADDAEITDVIPQGNAYIQARPDLYPQFQTKRKPPLLEEDSKDADSEDDKGTTSKKAKKTDNVENKALDSSNYQNKSAK